MKRTFLITGTVLGLLAVVFGAFGAHGLKQIVSAESVASFETGVRYQMYHAFFMLFVGIWNGMSQKRQKTLFWFVVIGVFLFSGSIYALVLAPALSMDLKSIGFLTPIGGTLLIVAWFFLGYVILTEKSAK